MSKYRAVRTNGYASKAEAAYAAVLQLLASGQYVSGIVKQPKVYLTAARILYKPDFLHREDGRWIWTDVKGFSTPVFAIKARLWKHYGPGLLRIVKKEGRGFVTVKEIHGPGTT